MHSNRIPEIPENWQNFGVCLIFHLGFPLFPILMEFVFASKVQASSLAITTAIYAITIGGSSKSLLQFIVGIAVGLFFSSLFGFVSSGNVPQSLNTELVSFIFMIFIALAQIVERYNRHVINQEIFFVFRNTP